MSSANDDNDLRRLLEHIRVARGTDFSGYKRASLTRRIEKRMQAVGVANYSDYLDQLQADAREFGDLFDCLLINVTAFFRDPPAWDALAGELAVRVMSGKAPDEPIRVWSAGTSTGQEAYTIAMVIAESIGIEDLRSRTKIYSTDIDDRALTSARRAVYTEDDLAAVPDDLRAKYFEGNEGDRAFRSDLRRTVIFGRHDLVQDAPISKLDLLVCRNTLMYLNAETQRRVLERLHFGLADGGLLLVGQAETLMTHTELFTPVDLRHRLFVKVDGGSPRPGRSGGVRVGSVPRSLMAMTGHALIDRAFAAAPVPHVMVDADGAVALANDAARALFRLADDDVGRPFQDIDLSYRPIELRSSIELAYASRRPVVHRDVALLTSGTTRYLDIEVLPMFEPDGSSGGVSITFTDVSRHRELRDELAESKRQLEAAYEELQSTNEELETTNEELQSTVEELETTNEELQSTNEELETMNEELQSTNEELHGANEALRSRGNELNEVNAFLESVLGGLRRAVVVVDTAYTIQVWNRHAEDLWGLRREEVIGSNFLGIDIGLPIDQLRPVLRHCLEGEESEDVSVDAHNRRGQPISCEIWVSPRRSPNGEVEGALLLMQEHERPAP